MAIRRISNECFVVISAWGRRKPRRVLEFERYEYQTFSREHIPEVLQRARQLHPAHVFYLVHCKMR